MLDELIRWLNLGAFERMPKKQATNVIDAHWVLKWKEVNGKRIIQAGLVVRGFQGTPSGSAKHVRRHHNALGTETS